MSYLVLARKARPQRFSEVVGQGPVVKTLQNSLQKDRVAHAILFSGVRGVGKTTLARIMAKALNCANGPASEPCNECLSCQQITNGASLDLFEIDGASNRGIQEVRELKEKIKYLPTSSPYKIVIIDEVHMLTTEAFNALLKTLEEPPAHVYFMFATTELQKIPITILSRCQRYELQRVTSEELTRHFSKLAESENIKIDARALSLIVREAEGSVRDGLSLLDKVFSYEDKDISAEDVVEVLGLVSRDILHNIASALLESNPTLALQSLDEVFKFGADTKRFLGDLLEYFRALLLIKIEGGEELLDLPAEDVQSLKELAGAHTSETIHLKLKLLMSSAEKIRFSAQPRLLLETTFLSVIETDNVVDVTTLLSKVASLSENSAMLPAGSQLEAVSPPEGEQKKKSPPVEPAIEPVAEPVEEVPTEIAPPPEEPQSLSDDSVPPWEEPPSPPPPLSEPAIVDHPEPVESSNEEPLVQEPQQTRQIRKDWLDFIAYVKDRKPWMAQNLQQASSHREEGQELQLEFDDSADCTLLKTVENRKTLTEYVLDFFQKEYIIHFITPVETDDPDMKASEGPKKQRQKLANHPIVRMTEEIFGGQVGDVRIGPRSR
ncbi:MAG: DNA polymerase III subunit gamma/tau [Desulfobulbaceae bacterium]|nr:MAG: DNA polymerase III subunit gamma/tau [Desulfobulbaceae bacterium]